MHHPIVNTFDEPVQRYLRHAIGSRDLLAHEVVLEQRAKMRLKPESPYISMECHQILKPSRAFDWYAKFKWWHLSMMVHDQYEDGKGFVNVHCLNIPVFKRSGANITRSSRGRLAAEIIWCPSALLLNKNIQLRATSNQTIEIIQTIDDENISINIEIDDTGAVKSLTMLRFGNESRADWGLTPYGFTVKEEKTFDGYTIPSKLRGGWWYKTSQFSELNASEFEIVNAEYT